MQIEVDFEVYKALTALRKCEEDSYNEVLHRLLAMSEDVPATGELGDSIRRGPANVFAQLRKDFPAAGTGAWIGNVFLPDGTKFRATYKGRTFRAEIKGEIWVDEAGTQRRSPSDAAGAISGTKVNGWRFWYAMRPTDVDWHRLDDLRK